MGMFGSGYSLYDPYRQADAVTPPSAMPSTLNPVQGLTPDMMPKKQGLFGGWNTPGADGSTKWDQVGMIGASLRDDPNVLANMQQSMQRQQQLTLERQKQAEAEKLAKAKQAALMGFAGKYGGAPPPGPPLAGQVAAPGAGQMPGAPMQPQGQGMSAAQPQAGFPGVRAMAPDLINLAAQGVDISDYVTLADKASPDIGMGPDGHPYDKRDPSVLGQRFGNPANVNNTILDLNDPKNLNRTVPTLDKGQQFLYDENGRPAGVRNMDGSVQAAAQMAGAVAGAQKAGEAPYTPDTRTDPHGAPVYGTVADRLGGGGAGGLRGQAPADAAYANDTAKNSVTQFQGIQAAGQQALSAIPKYQRLGELLDGYSGNKLSPVGVDLAQMARGIPGLGNFDAKLPNKEAAQAITNQLALSLRDPSQGGGMPGALSNSDRDFLVKSVPNLAQTDQGRRVMIQSAIKLNQRNAEMAQKARAWQQRFGRIDAADNTGKNFFDYAQTYAERNPLFGHGQ